MRGEIKITVIGRKSGKTISIPVWFVLEDETLYLLPVQGSETQWYKNVVTKPTIRIDARGVEAEFRAKPVADAKASELAAADGCRDSRYVIAGEISSQVRRSVPLVVGVWLLQPEPRPPASSSIPQQPRSHRPRPT